MAVHDDVSRTIVLPVVDGIHEAIIAFLQTSEHGVWAPDSEMSSNAFQLHFIRGNWGRSFFGFGSKRVPENVDFDPDDYCVPHSKPMLLEVTIRPSPENIRVALRFAIYSSRWARDGYLTRHEV